MRGLVAELQGAQAPPEVTLDRTLERELGIGSLERVELSLRLVQLTRIMFPFLTLVALAAALMGMLNSLGHFFVPALSPDSSPRSSSGPPSRPRPSAPAWPRPPPRPRSSTCCAGTPSAPPTGPRSFCAPRTRASA